MSAFSVLRCYMFNHQSRIKSPDFSFPDLSNEIGSLTSLQNGDKESRSERKICKAKKERSVVFICFRVFYLEK